MLSPVRSSPGPSSHHHCRVFPLGGSVLAVSGRAVITALALAVFGCQPSDATTSLPPPATPLAAAPGGSAPKARSGPDDARGGRLYDNWRAEKAVTGFVPDTAGTAALDGQGGPNQNGTLNDGSGHPLANTGHDYRLKNLFGWDLRGSEGIYGSGFEHKPFVLARNLLTDARPASELREWLAKGDATLPAFGEVLDADDLDDLVAFLIKMRDRQLAHPGSIFALDPASPKHYVLAAGGDAERGRERYAISCADCHGDDGRNMTIDETQSLGSMSRASAYEVWFKMLNGQPGTDMRRQILDPSAPDQERAILDVLAALCDRKTFPAMAGVRDVPDADPRCSSYLK